MKILPLILLGSLAVGLVGCSSIDARIKEKAEVYAKLSPADQQTIQRGYITQGFTPDMVYMALDKPESVVPGPAANEESWMYHNFYSQSGSDMLPSQKLVVHNGAGASLGGTGAVPNSGGAPKAMPGAIGGTGWSSNGHTNTFSVEADTANENIKVEAHIRVKVHFIDGKVTSIEIVRTA